VPGYRDRMGIAETVSRVVADTPHVTWSIAITGRPGAEAAADPGRRLSTASIGKILLLAEAARQIEEGTLDEHELLPKDPAVAIADSGLWQHLTVDALPVADVAALVAAVSDNWATNVLLGRVGLPAVHALAARLKLANTQLNDRVRGFRAPGDTTRLSNGSARELASLMHRLARGKLVSPAVSKRLDGWLAINTDLSMVASAFDLDPLAHVQPDRGFLLRNKTGTDTLVRADVGYVRYQDRRLAYAVLANWEGDATAEVMRGMRLIGESCREELTGSDCGVQAP
jgi:beta-lactamase class A